MRPCLCLLLLLTLLVASCQTHVDNSTCFFRRTTWWDRRMDRLEAWDRHHGYPIGQTKEAILNSTAVSLAIAGALVGGAGCCAGAAGYYWYESQGISSSDDAHHRSKSK